MATGTGPVDDTLGAPATGAVAPPERRRRTPVFVWSCAGLVLVGGVALAITAGKPEIALAAIVGVVIPAVILVVLRLWRRPATAAGASRGRLRRRVLLLLLVAAAATGVVCLTSNILVRDTNPGVEPAPAARERASYHASGRVVGDAIVLDETIVVDERAISRTMPAAPTDVAPEPEVTVPGWRDAGLVSGNPSFERTRNLSWSRTSTLATTATVPLDLGYLKVTVGDRTREARLTAQDGSRVEIAVPKGALGTAIPAVASRADLPAGNRQEVITFSVDVFVSDVSFDLLRSALRNPVGHALYDVSLWGFWQWAIGAGATVVGGLVVDKLAEAIWRLLSRRARSMFGRGRKAGQAA